MKKVKITKGLSLNKETVSRLNENQMADFKGGALAKTAKGGSCVTNAKSCFRKCRSWFGCYAEKIG